MKRAERVFYYMEAVITLLMFFLIVLIGSFMTEIGLLKGILGIVLILVHGTVASALNIGLYLSIKSNTEGKTK